jgi:Skp family chaperone for outer membrane proteins
MRSDQDFKFKLKGMQEELNQDIYNQLSEIITEWSNSNGIDLVMGKMEVVFNTDNVEVTNKILEIIKSKDLFYQPTEKES